MSENILTREQIERWRVAIKQHFINEGMVDKLCDMALRSVPKGDSWALEESPASPQRAQEGEREQEARQRWAGWKHPSSAPDGLPTDPRPCSHQNLSAAYDELRAYAFGSRKAGMEEAAKIVEEDMDFWVRGDTVIRRCASRIRAAIGGGG